MKAHERVYLMSLVQGIANNFAIFFNPFVDKQKHFLRSPFNVLASTKKVKNKKQSIYAEASGIVSHSFEQRGSRSFASHAKLRIASHRRSRPPFQIFFSEKKIKKTQF